MHIISDLEKYVIIFVLFIKVFLFSWRKRFVIRKIWNINWRKSVGNITKGFHCSKKLEQVSATKYFVQKDKINAAFRVENTRLEDIILLMVKEGV